MYQINNLFAGLSPDAAAESFTPLLHGGQFRLERIASSGQATPAGAWYDQDEDEWVMLLSGAATLLFAEDEQTHTLQPGDYVFIPAHCRHRVVSTASRQISVWLALHVMPQANDGETED